VRAVLVRVGALARRDLKIELSYHFQFVLRLFAILTSLAMFFFLSRLVGDAQELAEYETGYFEFVLLGLLVMALSQACVNAFGESIERAQNDGTLEILLSTSTRLPTLLAGTLVVPLGLAFVEGAFYLSAGWLFADLIFTFGRALLALVLLVLTLGTFAALGILSAGVIVLTKRGDPFSALAMQGTNLLAGAMFPVTVMPEWMQALSRLVPAFYGLRGMRELLLARGGLADVAVDLGALVAFNLLLLPIAFLLLSRAVRMARVVGTLGNR
jgi:ABC-2 type transport system permease protein